MFSQLHAQLLTGTTLRERVKVLHTISEPPQTTQHTTASYLFQNLHGCTININHPLPQQNTIVSDAEVNVDKLIALILADSEVI